MPETLDVIAFGAHPDDAEAACGGLLVRLARAGYRVAICDLTRGELASNGSLEERAREAGEAASLLGLCARLDLGLPDGGLDGRDREQIAAVVRLLRERGPRLVIAPHDRSRHPDHTEAALLLRRAQFFTAVGRFASERSPTARPALLLAPDSYPVQPSFVVDIGDVLPTKLAALRCYRSQFERRSGSVPTFINDPGYLQRVETMAHAYGQLVGRPAAEPYVTETCLCLDDPLPALSAAREEAT